MEFNLTKKGYSPQEVEEYISAIKREYENTIVKQRDRIKEMLQEKERLENELAAYKSKSSQISKAIMSAVSKAEEIERLSHVKYDQELARLKAFHEKWTQYYDKILTAYPLDAQLAEVGEFNRRMDKILSRVEPEVAAATEASEQPSPLKKINDYLSQESVREQSAQAQPQQPLSPLERARQSTAAAAAPKTDYADRSPSGFSFEEALNPTEDLEDILKDLGF